MAALKGASFGVRGKVLEAKIYIGCKAREKIVNTVAYKKDDIENALRTGFISLIILNDCLT